MGASGRGSMNALGAGAAASPSDTTPRASESGEQCTRRG
jgi:hypothetical protein